MRLLQYIKFILILTLLSVIMTAGLITYFIFQLPDDSILQKYKPNVMTRIHASNGELVREFSREYRIFIPINDVPKDVRNAFISAEDKNFYRHYGVDPTGILKKKLSVILIKDQPYKNLTTSILKKNFILL